MIETDKSELPNRLQTSFVRVFDNYRKLKASDIRPMDYETKQAWSRTRQHIMVKSIAEYIPLFRTRN